MAELTITVKIDDTDQTVLKNDLLDIDAWVQMQWQVKLITVGSVCKESGQIN